MNSGDRRERLEKEVIFRKPWMEGKSELHLGHGARGGQAKGQLGNCCTSFSSPSHFLRIRNPSSPSSKKKAGTNSWGAPVHVSLPLRCWRGTVHSAFRKCFWSTY